jgi:hypothetical protein
MKGPLKAAAPVASVEYLMNCRRLNETTVPAGEEGVGMEPMTTVGAVRLTRRKVEKD